MEPIEVILIALVGIMLPICMRFLQGYISRQRKNPEVDIDAILDIEQAPEEQESDDGRVHYHEFDSRYRLQRTREGIDVTDKIVNLGVQKIEGYRFVFFDAVRFDGDKGTESNVLAIMPDDDDQTYTKYKPMMPSKTPDVVFKETAVNLSAQHLKLIEERTLRESLKRFAESPMLRLGEEQPWVNDEVKS